MYGTHVGGPGQGKHSLLVCRANFQLALLTIISNIGLSLHFIPWHLLPRHIVSAFCAARP
jgi:hypothetical protein